MFYQYKMTFKIHKNAMSLCYLFCRTEIWNQGDLKKKKKSPSESFNSVQVKPGQVVEISKLRDNPKVMALINTMDLCGMEIMPPN